MSECVFMSKCVFYDQGWNEAPYCSKHRKYLDNGCGDCKPVTVDDMATGNVVEVVRCKDCEWWTILPPDKQFIDGRVYGTCYKWSTMAKDDICTQKHYYCNYGERGNDETD